MKKYETVLELIRYGGLKINDISMESTKIKRRYLKEVGTLPFFLSLVITTMGILYTSRYKKTTGRITTMVLFMFKIISSCINALF